MKNKSFIFPTVVFLWIIFFFATPVQQEPPWKGTIEEIDGVTVVRNPKEPMYGSEVFHLEEELSTDLGVSVDLVLKSTLRPTLGRAILSEVVYL